MVVSKLLVVDDEQSICWGLSRLGKSLGHEVVTASSAEQALEVAATERPELVILDVRLPGMDGLTAMAHLQQLLGQVPIIIITAFGDLQTAVDAVRHGAFEYIVKPFDLEQVERAVERGLAAAGNVAQVPNSNRVVGGLVGRSAAMQETFKRIALAAASDASVFLCGESGTGKELVARAVHQYSRRASGPFVAVNVAALSSSLAESELFGHVRGAFTGADAPRKGLLSQADGGTLFLDEVADIPLPVQVKLLRALEHGEVLPVGASEPVKSNFRVVSATHQKLTDKVQEGSFRHDLYFRLSAFQIDLPPLRERGDDIHELAEHFLHQVVGPGDGASLSPVLAAETRAELQQRPWYGNVRELSNAIQHAVILARGGTVLPEHLPPPVPAALVQGRPTEASDDARLASLLERWAAAKLASPQETEQLYEQLLALVEPPLIRAALDDSSGQVASAARKLGLHRITLRKKMQQHDIDGKGSE
jgi:two-component system nitrogen regulation response regulator GlnG